MAPKNMDPSIPNNSRIILAFEPEADVKVLEENLLKQGHSITRVCNADKLCEILLPQLEKKVKVEQFNVVILSATMPPSINLALYKNVLGLDRSCSSPIKDLKVIVLSRWIVH